MKKLIGIASMVLMFSSCTDDNTVDVQQNVISAITLESTFVSLDKQEIPVDFTFHGTSEVNSYQMSVSFNGIVKLNGAAVNGTFTYHQGDDVTLTPNAYGRTTAVVQLTDYGTTITKDFYTIESSNTEPYVFINNKIQRASQHSNGKLYYETRDGSSYGVNKIEIVVVSVQPYTFTLSEQQPILNTASYTFSGNELLNTHEIGIKDQNYGSNQFDFTFSNGFTFNYPFTYIKTYLK